MERLNLAKPEIAQKFLDFIKYNNAFVIGLVLAVLGGGTIFAASPEARNAVIGEKIVKEVGIDNAALLGADLDDFAFDMTVDNVSEDESSYYVDYSFSTLGIEGNIWQIILRESRIVIAKGSLAGQDLGLYVQAQLANVVQNELAYLKRVQAAEKEKGETKIVKTAEYTGLIGLVLDLKNQAFFGYEPVIDPALAKLAWNTEPQIVQILPLDQIATTTEAVDAGELPDKTVKKEQKPAGGNKAETDGGASATSTAER